MVKGIDRCRRLRGVPGLLACFLFAPPMASAQTVAADCAACHAEQAQQFAASVHHAAVRCYECHGGEVQYALTSEQRRDYLFSAPRPASQPGAATQPGAVTQPAAASRPAFDHGPSFRGKSPRAAVPELCGSCHANIERMNPYGLRTDQLAGYWTSGHGRRLLQDGDERVAVCIDCHGVHDVLKHDNAHSRTYFQNIPATCGRCHADANLMNQYGFKSEIVEQYRNSVHGQNVLEKGDSGSPVCSTCHGSHAAVPPGYAEVGHVCGRCHQQIEEYFVSGVHGRVPGIARCTGCHGKGGDPKNHLILEASPPVERIEALYTTLRNELGDRPALQERFHERLGEMSGSLRFETVCLYCHAPGRTDPHARFFTMNDEKARERGTQLAAALAKAQWTYARTAERVARVARGVLLVREEALQVEDAKTELMALNAFMHTVDVPQVQERVGRLEQICEEINASLDVKEGGLARRRLALALAWVLIPVFCVLMYRKYLELKHAYVGHAEPAAPPAAVSLGRRRLLNGALRVMGAVGVLALVWPAIAYVLPARRRGGASERVSAGKESDWAPWEARKVSVAGKPVAVVRTDAGFRAYSLVCTHLGCIVHWTQAQREFHCPCHAARFDALGKVLGGPPPRPLPEYAVSVVQGDVIVSGAVEG